MHCLGSRRKVRRDKIKVFIGNLRGFDEVISELDERLWNTMVERWLCSAYKEVRGGVQ